MKKIFKSPQAPKELKKFAAEHPGETWEHFRRRCREGYKDVRAQIYQDQHGLCAYCEISIKFAEDEADIDDFRVEHFHPKSDTVPNGKNWHLAWNNLLGVCHGGSQKDVPEAERRYSARKNDRSCDVPKGGQDLSGIILNPLKIPAGVRLFRYAEYSGKIIMDERSCPLKLQRKAINSVRELNLNAPRLQRLRKAVIEALQEEMFLAENEGVALEETVKILAAEFLSPDKGGCFRPFFSVIRWYLGPAAEEYLASARYKF